MSDQQRMLLAVAASIAIFYAWSKWFAPPAPPPQQVVTPSATTQPMHQATQVGNASVIPSDARALGAKVHDPQMAIAEALIVLKNDKTQITLTNDGARPVSWTMSDYLTGAKGKEAAIDLITGPNVAPMRIAIEGFETRLPDFPRYLARQIDDKTAQFSWRSKDLEIVRTYQLSDRDYVTRVSVQLHNLTSVPLQTSVALGWEAQNEATRRSGFLSALRGPQNVWSPLYHVNNEVERLTNPKDYANLNDIDSTIYWGGIENRYFMASIIPSEVSLQGKFTAKSLPDGALGASIKGAPIVIPSGGMHEQAFLVYAGPKKIDYMNGVGVELEKAIDLGFFSVIAIPLLWMLNAFYAMISNYGVAIILLTLVVKGLLHPLTKASLKSMRKMQKLQPQLKELREKHKDDKQQQQMAMMQLFKTHKVNPMAGCLPMLLQFPIYIALYQVLWNSVELYRAPFFGYFTDLSSPDPYYVTPVLLGIAFFLQQKFTPSPTMDPAQKKIMMFMPIMFTGFMFFLPSGLVIYILVNTAFTVLQQWLMNRGLGFRDLFRGNLTEKNA